MDFNHISRKLTEEQVDELSKLYHTYHKQYWCYKKMFKKSKRMDLALKLSSVVFTTAGAVVGSVTLNPIFLACVSGTGVLLQTITTQKNFSKKTESCRYAYQSYQKLLNKLKLFLRSGDIDEFFERELAMVDDQVADICPPISESYEKLHTKRFPPT